MQTLYNSGASKHCVATTFQTKKASKQVNRQDTLFTISCSVSAEEFDLFLLYIPQCHKHSAVSLSFKGPSVTGSGGKDQIFISKTQNGKFKWNTVKIGTITACVTYLTGTLAMKKKNLLGLLILFFLEKRKEFFFLQNLQNYVFVRLTLIWIIPSILKPLAVFCAQTQNSNF